jgi:hypothetical protein
MSLRNLVFVSLLALPIGLCKAQTAPAQPVEPTAIGIIYRINPTTQELMKLPDEQPRQILEGCGFGKGCNYVVVSGKTSSFRLKADEKAEFVFQTGSPEKVSLYRFDHKKNNRQFLTEKIAPAVYGGSEDVKGLSIEVSKYGASSYKLVPAAPLTPGEYAIIIAGEVYTFGVD